MTQTSMQDSSPLYKDMNKSKGNKRRDYKKKEKKSCSVVRILETVHLLQAGGHRGDCGGWRWSQRSIILALETQCFVFMILPSVIQECGNALFWFAL